MKRVYIFMVALLTAALLLLGTGVVWADPPGGGGTKPKPIEHPQPK